MVNASMRTTITLEPDVEALLKRLMRERRMSFKEAVNYAIRTGLAGSSAETSVRTPTFAMGFEPSIPWDKALRLAADLEDEELTRRLTARK
jgi:hypothetical protein